MDNTVDGQLEQIVFDVTRTRTRFFDSKRLAKQVSLTPKEIQCLDKLEDDVLVDSDMDGIERSFSVVTVTDQFDYGDGNMLEITIEVGIQFEWKEIYTFAIYDRGSEKMAVDKTHTNYIARNKLVKEARSNDRKTGKLP